jgi:HEAT repeat protein
MDALLALMRSYGVPRVSELAAYSLGQSHNRRFTKAFISCLRDQRQHDATRGQAAEALGELYNCASKARRGWKAAESALLDSLSDSSPTVRFWCCFALGNLRSKRAIASLEHISRNDSAIAPGWWYVKEEAADALERIAGGAGEDRIPVHQRIKTIA